jgi:TP901 family phage tail tape measure protein
VSDFIAEGRILIRPDTTKFRAQLTEEVNRAISQVQSRIKPIEIAAIFSTGQTGAVIAQASALSKAQATATASTLGLADAAKVENSAFGRQAVILAEVTTATQAKGAADVRAAVAAREHAVGQGQVGKAALASTAGMLGLRGAVLTAGSAFIAATVGFQALGKAVQSSIDFQRELNVFAVTAGATADQMDRVRETARALGRDITLPGVAASDAAQTLQELARAGLSVEESLGAVRGTLQLATAAEIDNASAAELVANALNSFKLSGDQATRVADLLAGAAAQSQGSITDMGLALKQTSSIASGLGISIEDTVTILTQLSRAGLSASDAGTSFRQTLLRLIQDLPKVNKEVDALGLHLRDASGNIRPQVFEELGKRLKTLTPAARQLAVANLGGADAIRTLLILTRAQAGEFDTLEAAITRTGIAQEQAAARTQGLGGDVEAAKNEFADLGVTVGNVASGPLGLLVRTATAAAGAVNDVSRAAEDAGGNGGFLTQLGHVVDGLQDDFARLNFQFQEGVRNGLKVNSTIGTMAGVFDTAAGAVEAFGAALEGALRASLQDQGLPKDQGLGVQQIINRVSGFDTAETAARIRGNTTDLLNVLESERAFLEQQLERKFVRNRQGLFNKLQSALLGVTTDIASITKQGATAEKNAAADAARAQKDADQSLLELLSNRRDDAERKAAVAATTESLADDIRAQNRIQALIKQQIIKIRDQIQDEKARKAAIRELRIALIESRREEEALRKERLQQAAANQQESVTLDIDLAVTVGNTNKEIQARLKLIALLKKQQAAVKRGTLEWKRLRNEIAEQEQAIKDAKKQKEKADKTSNTFATAAFEFLQAQQGFAANLFGNLIPSGATGGLVGNVSAAAQHPFDTGIQLATSTEKAKGLTGPTAGQGNVTNQLLLRILHALERGNRRGDSPEAKHQRRVGSADGDGPGGPLDII